MPIKATRIKKNDASRRGVEGKTQGSGLTPDESGGSDWGAKAKEQGEKI
jgi:hypothetical protein